MLDIQYIREHPEAVRESMVRRRCGDPRNVTVLLKRDEERKELLQLVETFRKQRNEFSAQIPSLSAQERDEVVNKVKHLKITLQETEERLQGVEEEYTSLLMDIPNVLAPEVPRGRDDTQNVVLRTWGELPSFAFVPKDHVEIGEKLGLIDFDAGTKVSGTKFYFLKKDAVLLQLALQQYALDFLISEGFLPVYSPVLAKQDVLSGAGFNPRGPEKQIYNIEEEGLSMIATSEITLNGYYRDHVFDEQDLPLKLVGISECYRREAGSWGRFSKGLYRVHHFVKVEMFIFCVPSLSVAMHEYILSLEEKIYQNLGIPYRVVDICDGDLGAMAFRKYDIEAWMPGRDGGGYGEITSCSNCTDYQARRCNIKYKDGSSNRQFVHTLNGTAIAISRVLLAILENYQQEDGSVIIPPVLRKFMGGKERITKRTC